MTALRVSLLPQTNYKHMLRLFAHLPLAALVEGKVLVLHGGLFRAPPPKAKGQPRPRCIQDIDGEQLALHAAGFAWLIALYHLVGCVTCSSVKHSAMVLTLLLGALQRTLCSWAHWMTSEQQAKEVSTSNNQHHHALGLWQPSKTAAVPFTLPD
jgi:hypothetical protein